MACAAIELMGPISARNEPNMVRKAVCRATAGRGPVTRLPGDDGYGKGILHPRKSDHNDHRLALSHTDHTHSATLSYSGTSASAWLYLEKQKEIENLFPSRRKSKNRSGCARPGDISRRPFRTARRRAEGCQTERGGRRGRAISYMAWSTGQRDFYRYCWAVTNCFKQSSYKKQYCRVGRHRAGWDPPMGIFCNDMAIDLHVVTGLSSTTFSISCGRSSR